MANAGQNLINAKAKDQIVDNVRDLYTAKLTLPLGNPNLRLLHTNQFLYTELPTGTFDLENMDAIANALNSTYSRYSGYTLNRWYIQGITITNDGKSAKMELELNPFASSLIKYRDDKQSFEKAWDEANNTNNTSSNSSSNKNNAKVKSVAQKITLSNVKGFNKSDQEFIKKVVTKALKARNNPVKPLQQAFAIYDYYNKNHVYSYYICMDKMKKHGFEGTWKLKGHNCGDGAATIVAMMRCANLDADIMHKSGHFYVRVKIDGKYYYCDQAGATGQHNRRTLGSAGSDKNVWGGISSSASVVGFKYC